MNIKPVFIIPALMILLSSCSPEIPVQQNISSSISGNILYESSDRDLFAMDTFMTMKAYGENREKALSAASARILSLEEKLSVTSKDSEIWKINHAGGGITEISQETADIISFALDIAGKTDGALEPTIYPVLREWGFTTGEYRIPSAETLSELLKKTGYKKVNLTGNMINIPVEMNIDLGAAAKGYTGDAVTQIFRDNGVTSAVISLGGNVQTLGSKPDGSDWKVSVRDPFDENSQMCVISVSDKAVVTSGDYERYFIGEDGRKYCHIINPSDGYPADSGLVSVTVIGESGIQCDCLSTALFVMGKDRAYEYWKENGGFEMILVGTDGVMYVTAGIDEKLEVVNGMEKSVLK